MSELHCVNCGERVDTAAGICEICGAAGEMGAGPTRTPAGLHPLAPVVFAVSALGVGVAGTVLSSLALGIPLGLLGGGIGVWMLERGRRLTN